MSLRGVARRRPFIALVVSVSTFVLAGVLWSAPVAAASPCPVPGSFEIDGDMTQATCTPAGDDWNTPGLGVTSTTQGGTYSTSGKDHQDPSGWSSTGSTPDKTNFEKVYATSRIVGGKYYTYVAWERTDTSGTQGYAIEIDNAPPRTANDANHTPQPDRSKGGVVVYISSVGSGAPQFSSACTFVSQATYGSTCTTANADITAAINAASISDPLRGTTQAAGSFFEVAIDVSDLTGIVPSCPGETAASAYVRSVTGQVDNGNLKGYMNPLTLQPDSTCVAPAMSTTATPGGDLNAAGASQHDTVVVGTGVTPGVGTVDFYLCQPADVTANGCESGGTKVGATEPLAADGTASSDDVTGATTPDDNATGTYCWRAEFTPGEGDHNYLPATHTNASSECFTVVHGTPSISTQIAVTGDHQPGLGFTTYGDAAQLSGFVGSVTGETVTFTLYGPFGATIPATCTSGTPVLTTSGTLNASGHATTSQTFTPTQAGQYVWIASYPGDTLNDPISGGCSDANEHATVVGAQVDVAKSANPPGPVSAGESIGFDITVSNDGSVPATGVHVHDALPSGADGISGGDLDWSLSPAYTGCLISGAVGAQVLDCDFSQVNGPASLPVIHVQSPTTQAECGTVKNQASVSTTNGTGGDSDVASVSVLCASLSIDKTADADTVSAGTPIGFTVTAANAGPGAASGVLVNDPLPAGGGVSWAIDAAGTSGPLSCSMVGNVPSQTLRCTGTLASGASQVVHVVSGTVFASCGSYDNHATVSATNVTGVPFADASTTVQCPDPAIVKTADADTVDAGDAIGFTVVASNADAEGAGVATGVVLNDPLPFGPDLSWTIDVNPGNCSIDTDAQTQHQTLMCTAVDLPPGQSESVHVTSATAFASCATYVNTASMTLTNGPVQAPEGDVTAAAVGDPVVYSADASVTVNCPDLAVTKTADADAVNGGEPVGFTIEATNAGPGTAFAAVLQDPLPSQPGVSWSISPDYAGPGTCSIDGPDQQQVLTCALGDFATGGDALVHVVSDTTTDSCGDLDNTVQLLSGNAPTVEASATTTVNCAAVSPELPPPTPPLAATGPGPVQGQFDWAFLLIVLGMTLALAGRRRRTG